MREIFLKIPDVESADVMANLLKKGQQQIPHGAKTKLAKFMNCHPSYLGQIINRKVTMTTDQAMLFAEWCELSKMETELFITLVSFERAGQSSLREYYRKKIDQVLESANSVKSHLEGRRELSESQLVEYFSNWGLQIVHAALQIETISLPAQIAKKLMLPEEVVLKALHKLEQMGLVKQEESDWKVLQNNLHLANHSGAQNHFHVTSRLLAATKMMQNQQQDKSKEFRFSSILIASDEQFKFIRRQMVKLVSEIAEEVAQADSKDLAVVNLDLFLPAPN